MYSLSIRPKTHARKALLCFVVLLFALCSVTQLYAQPSISSFSPTTGPVGTAVTISGKGFSATPANDIVFFGAVKAVVSAASSTSLTVKVPVGATYQPITVTVNGLTGYSEKPFVVTFASGQKFHPNSFSFAYRFDSSTTGIIANDIVSTDFDGDGKSDLAVVDATQKKVHIYRNTSTNGVVSFSPKIDYPTGNGPFNVAAADLNGDGKPEIVIANQSDNTVSVYKNISSTGSISFASNTSYPTNIAVSQLAIADFDLDGRPDIAMVDGGYYSILRNTETNGAISFAARVDLYLFNTNFIHHIISGDFDNDGKIDIAMVGVNGGLSVVKNTSSTGSISFGNEVDLQTDANPSRLAVGDFDGDGYPEIVCSYLISNFVSVYKNSSTNGNISFQARKNFVSGFFDNSDATDVVISDLDGDGKVDMAVLNQYESLSLFKNTSSTGVVNFDAKVDCSVYGENIVLANDVDGDGRADLTVMREGAIAEVYKNTVNAPFITSATPLSGTEGTTVQITGVNFNGATSVSFGGLPAASFKINSATSITATVGRGASGGISVTNVDGTSTYYNFDFQGRPVVSSFSPALGANGTMVTINGYNFTNVEYVSFGGVITYNFYVVNTNTITATVGQGASGSVCVKNSFGADSVAGFTFYPPPTIKSFTPVAGIAGTKVSISGTHFSTANSVSFGGINALSFKVVSDTMITAVVGERGSGAISVKTKGGTAVSLSGFFCKPIITSISPDSVFINTSISVYGYNFTGATAITFGGDAAAYFNVYSDSFMVANVREAHSGDVIVTGPGGKDTLAGFKFMSPPTITSFSPTIGGRGTKVTIIGTYFLGTTAVKFNSYKAASFKVLSDTVIEAVVDTSDAGIGYIEVLNPYGYTTSYSFTFSVVPQITSISPVSGPAGSTVTISGANFNSTLTDNVVYFGAAKAVVKSESQNSLVVTAPAGADYGKISVTNTSSHLTAFSSQYYVPTFNAGVLSTNSFSGKTILETPSHPGKVSVADLDGDNKPDLIVPNTQGNSFSIFRNTGSGNKISFSARVDFAVSHPLLIIINDIDGDGKKDICVFQNDTTYSAGSNAAIISVFKNESTIGSLNFGKQLEMHLGVGVDYLNVQDFDNDGKPDFVLTTSTENYIRYCSNATTAGAISFYNAYQSPLSLSSYSSILPYGFLFDDVDGDGFPDLTIHDANASSGYSPVISIYSHNRLNTTTGNTAYSAYAYQFYKTPFGGAYADIDLDGKLDLVETGGYDGFSVLHHTYLNNQTANHYFGFDGPPFYYKGPSIPQGITYGTPGIEICDIDGDGRPDVITRNQPGDSTFGIFKNVSTQGNVSINDRVLYSAGNLATALTSGDIDGDGKPDIIVTYANSNEIAILKNGLGTLPLTLLNFTGKLIKNQTQLNWQTASEINAAYFNVERSTTGANFSAIGKLSATGNSSVTQSYNFVDEHLPAHGSQPLYIYYRLKMVDADGNFTYSNIVTVNIGGAGNTLFAVYPNPAKDFITVNLPATGNAAQLQITDMTGRVLRTVAINSNDLKKIISVTGLAKGVYMVVWGDGEAKQSISVAIQ